MTRLNIKREYGVKNNKIEYRKEDPLIIHILGFLGTINIIGWRNNTTGRWSKKFQRYVKFKNQRIGISDILGILPDGRFLAIECKTANDRKRLDQELFITDINNNNGVGLFVWSIDDVIERLEKEGYINIGKNDEIIKLYGIQRNKI